MEVELRPLGDACNLRCRYCYQIPERKVGGTTHQYDLAVMKAALEKENAPFRLFGGEALLVPEADLEDLWAWGQKKFGCNEIQTNGVLINENHIRMFKQYHVNVGISIDGPDELNDARWAGSAEATRKATKKIEWAIRRLCEEKHYPGLIITIHRLNATAAKLPRLASWLRELDELGVCRARLHTLEVDVPLVREPYALSTEENIQAFLHIAKLEKHLKRLRFDVFEDIRNLLMGRDKDATCCWVACDPYTTASVYGVEADGQRTNCGRVYKEGICFVKAAIQGFERYLVLYHTPQEHGGCQGCRHFLMCKGQCPGTAIDNDWRNRSADCPIWKALFEYFEKEIEQEGRERVLSNKLRSALEGEFIKAWSGGQNAWMHCLLPTVQKRFAVGAAKYLLD
jgi:uncharacterized protein